MFCRSLRDSQGQLLPLGQGQHASLGRHAPPRGPGPGWCRALPPGGGGGAVGLHGVTGPRLLQYLRLASLEIAFVKEVGGVWRDTLAPLSVDLAWRGFRAFMPELVKVAGEGTGWKPGFPAGEPGGAPRSLGGFGRCWSPATSPGSAPVVSDASDEAPGQC